MGLRKLRKKIWGELERSRPGFEERVLPGDPVELCRGWLGYEPYEYMWPSLRDEGYFIANMQARQTGKTFNGMAKLLWYGFRYPGSLILVTVQVRSGEECGAQGAPRAPREDEGGGSSFL